MKTSASQMLGLRDYRKRNTIRPLKPEKKQGETLGEMLTFKCSLVLRNTGKAYTCIHVQGEHRPRKCLRNS